MLSLVTGKNSLAQTHSSALGGIFAKKFFALRSRSLPAEFLDQPFYGWVSRRKFEN
jgi:hypothetical protein